MKFGIKNSINTQAPLKIMELFLSQNQQSTINNQQSTINNQQSTINH